MPKFAAKTKVPEDRSIAQIRHTVARYGADQFAFGDDTTTGTVFVGFRMRGYHIRIQVPLPHRNDEAITHTPTGLDRSEEAQERAYQQAIQQRYRAAGLWVLARCEAVEAGIVSFEDAFLADILLPDKSTVGAWAKDQLPEIYRTNQMPALLPGLPTRQLPAAGEGTTTSRVIEEE